MQDIVEIPIRSKLRISNAFSHKQAALEGAGLALLPDYLINKEIKQGKLVRVLNDYNISANELYPCAWLVYPLKKFMPKRLLVLIDHLSDLYRSTR